MSVERPTRGGLVFTGIIEQVGRLKSAQEQGQGVRLEVEATGLDLSVGGSIAVNGCCLTAVSVSPRGFSCDLTPETLRRTAFSDRLGPGTRVNLELPLKANGRFDGHIVQGHVDGVGQIEALRPIGDSAELEVGLPKELARYVTSKGSIALDGISLTVARFEGDRFTVAVIPYTLEHTNLRAARPGEHVNLEMDILAKYIEALLRPRPEP
jgi:riboflavin synthase